MNPYSIADVLEGTLTEKKTYGIERESFRMSGLGTCPLRQLAERAGMQPTMRITKQARFKMWGGTVLGGEIQRLLELGGFLEKDWHEKEVHLGSYVGHTDGLTRKLPGTPKVVELKTSDDDAVTKYDWPKTYVWQGLGYALSNEAQVLGVDGLLCLQIGKNQGCSRERVFPLTLEWKRKILREIARMDRLWKIYKETGKLPGHLHRHGWENKMCPFLGLTPAAPLPRSATAGLERERELARFLDSID